MPMPVITQPMMIAPGDAPRDMSLGRLKTPPPIIEPTTRAMSGTRVSLPVAGRTSPTVTSAAAVAIPPAPRWYQFCGRVVDLGQLLNRLERVSHSANLVRIVRRCSPVWRSGHLRSRDRQRTTTRQPTTRRSPGNRAHGVRSALSTADRRSGPPPAQGRLPAVEAVAAVIRAESYTVDHPRVGCGPGVGRQVAQLDLVGVRGDPVLTLAWHGAPSDCRRSGRPSGRRP